MNIQSNFFEKTEHEDISMFSNQSAYAGKIDVVQMKFIGVSSVVWEELFEGFDRLYAITYSSGIGFINQLIKKFGYAEVIFGFEEVMTYNLQEIMAYQLKTIEKIRADSSQSKFNLISRIDNNSLKLFVAKTKLSHEKIYLMESNDGRKRVVMGSANMSYSAFSGKQRENICYLDDEKAFEWYKNSFEELKEHSSNNISLSALQVADNADNLDEIPVMQTVKVKKALVIQPETAFQDDIRFVLDVKELANKMKSYMPKSDKKGKILLSPESVIQTKRRIIQANIQEQELRSEYPHMVINIPFAEVTLNEKKLDLYPPKNDIKNDVGLFIDYLEGYRKFHGDVEGLQLKYFAFANWFFSTPFMATLRNIAVRYNHNLLPYPVFGLIYGQSKAGKTTFLETLLKMMIGQKTKITAPDFTRSAIDGLKRSVKGAPIIVDDLTQARFNQHAIETIKNDDFGVVDDLNFYPAVVISANEDVKAVAPEIIRRTVICHVQAGLKNTELMKTSIVRRVQSNIGTAFYREYLRRMIDVMPDLVNVLKDDDMEEAPDILESSSRIIHDIINEYYEGDLPYYVRLLSLEDYFGDKVTGSQVIRRITTAWQINKKAFEINKKFSQLRYNAGQIWEADRIMKELPEDLEAYKTREWIVMDLDKACDFFEIDFRRRGFSDLFRRSI
jgi:hypothetical protein